MRDWRNLQIASEHVKLFGSRQTANRWKMAIVIT